MEVAHKIKTNIFLDNRGSFSPLSLKVLEKDWVQSNVSVNPKKWTLRGLHFQRGSSSQAKLIKVIHGKILDFVLDMRIGGSEDLQFFEMGPGDEVFVPREYAHGFITLEENTVVQYLVDNDYDPKSEGSLVWSSFPEIKNRVSNIDITFEEDLIVISDKDLIEKL
jgi:dTDP-4-dehydrorhamnose 3,5-epimerase